VSRKNGKVADAQPTGLSIFGMPELDGKNIEVLVRYRGQVFTAGSGIVRDVHIENHISVANWFAGQHFELTGRKTISITLDAPERKRP
jgi:hypothetical protein